VTDDQADEQVDDWGSEFRCGDNKRMLGSVVKMTKTEWCRRRLWQTVDNSDFRTNIKPFFKSDSCFIKKYKNVFKCCECKTELNDSKIWS